MEWLLVIIAVLTCAALAFRTFRQYLNKRAFAVQGPHKIDERFFVRIGGIEQWIQIRGEDKTNPVLLILHGGRALSYMSFTALFRSWERHFTIVHWDRRGVGRTFGRNRRTGHGGVRLSQIVADGIELAHWLRKRLQKDKLILLGHSMGSIVGVMMAKERPDLFHLYIGAEQVVAMSQNETVSYELISAKLHATGNRKNLIALEKVGPPPYPNERQWLRKQKLMKMLDPAYRRMVQRIIPSMLIFSPVYSLTDLLDFLAANRFSGQHLFEDWMAFDAATLGNQLEMPVLVIQGETDIMAPTALAREWVAHLEAPDKAFVTIQSRGHLSLFMVPDLFLEKLVVTLRSIGLTQKSC